MISNHLDTDTDEINIAILLSWFFSRASNIQNTFRIQLLGNSAYRPPENTRLKKIQG